MDPKKAKEILNDHTDSVPQGKARSAAAFKKMNQKKWNNQQRTKQLQALYKKIKNQENDN